MCTYAPIFWYGVASGCFVSIPIGFIILYYLDPPTKGAKDT